MITMHKVLEHAFDVFKKEENVQKGLNTPNLALNNMKPLYLLYLPEGLLIVDNVLTRIECGVYS